MAKDKPQTGTAGAAPGVTAMNSGQTVAGRYRIEERVESGPGSVVLRARHVQTRERVSVRVLVAYTGSQQEVADLQLEKARSASRLRGRHVAKLLDVGVTEDGMPYVASEHLDGPTLEDELDRRERLPPAEAVSWILQACEGLAEAHAMGLVHGGLEPAKLRLVGASASRKKRRRQANHGSGNAEHGSAPSDETNDRRLAILDFGMGNPIESIADGSASAWFGVPAYLAPEQIRDPESVDTRADIWALGAILFEMIHGAPPFVSDTVSGTLVAIVYDAAPLAAEASYPLAKVIQRCLSKQPSERPRDVSELAAALAPHAGLSTSASTRVSERVRAALESPPDDEPMPDASATTSSVPPAIHSVPATSSAGANASSVEPGRSDTTVPSRRVRGALAAVERRARAWRSLRPVGVALAVSVALVSAIATLARVSEPTPAVAASPTAPPDVEGARPPFEVPALVPSIDPTPTTVEPATSAIPTTSATPPPPASVTPPPPRPTHTMAPRWRAPAAPAPSTTARLSPPKMPAPSPPRDYRGRAGTEQAGSERPVAPPPVILAPNRSPPAPAADRRRDAPPERKAVPPRLFETPR